MSQVVSPPDGMGDRLAAALRDGLKRVGIEAEVQVESVPSTLLHRALVVSPQWQALDQMDRQEVVWRILDRAFTRDEQLYIATVWPMTPEEMGE